MAKARRQSVSIAKRSPRSLQETHPMTTAVSATGRTKRSSTRISEGVILSSRRPWRGLALTTMIAATMVAQKLPVALSLAFDGNPHHAATVLNDLHTVWQAAASSTHSSLPTLPQQPNHFAFLSKESLLLTSSSSGSSSSITTMTLPSTAMTGPSASFWLAEMNAYASTLFTRYRTALQTDPLVTKMATGMVLAVMGDGIAQSRKSNMDETYDMKRAGAFAAFDACWRAVQQWSYPPIYQICNGKFTVGLLSSFSTLSTWSPSSSFAMPSTHLLAAWEQTLVSQLVLIPLLYYPVFYIVTSFVQSLTVEETIDRAKETFIPLMKRNLLFWIPVQFAVFGFVEEDFQIPILIVAGLAWTVILSLAAGGVSPSPKQDETVFDDLSVEYTMLQVDEVLDHSLGFNGTSFYAFSNATDMNFDVENDMNAADVSNIPTKNVLYSSESPKQMADEAADPIR